MAKTERKYFRRVNSLTGFYLYKTSHKFPRSIRVEPNGRAEDIKHLFETELKPRFEKIWERQKGKKKGFDFIFRAYGQLNFHGKRISFGIGTERFAGLKTKKAFDRAVSQLIRGPKHGLLAKFKSYLSRKGLKSLTIQGITVQVTGGAKPKATKKRKGNKKAIHRRRR